jgi:PhoH-like ATPase
MAQKVYVLDTNVVLQDIKNLYNVSDNGTNVVVIPETVLIELEDKKSFLMN